MPLKETKKHIKNEQPLVSIITPLYNAASFISECIASVQVQTYTNWEQIIVNDASTDNSSEVTKTFAQLDPRIKLIELDENQGAAYCRNHATELAKGGFIAFLDADDLWHPDKLTKQIRLMLDRKANVSFTSYLHIDEQGKSLKKRILAMPVLSYRKQHKNNYIGNLTGIYNAALIGKIMAPNIRKRQDWAVWLEAIKRSGKPATGLQEDLAYYRVRSDSMSSDKMNLIKYNYRFYREYLNYNSVKSAYCLFQFFMEYFFERPKYIQKL